MSLYRKYIILHHSSSDWGILFNFKCEDEARREFEKINLDKVRKPFARIKVLFCSHKYEEKSSIEETNLYYYNICPKCNRVRQIITETKEERLVRRKKSEAMILEHNVNELEKEIYQKQKELKELKIELENKKKRNLNY